MSEKEFDFKKALQETLDKEGLRPIEFEDYEDPTVRRMIFVRKKTFLRNLFDRMRRGS